MSEMSVCTPSNEVQCRLFRLPLRLECFAENLGRCYECARCFIDYICAREKRVRESDERSSADERGAGGKGDAELVHTTTTSSSFGFEDESSTASGDPVGLTLVWAEICVLLWAFSGGFAWTLGPPSGYLHSTCPGRGRMIDGMPEVTNTGCFARCSAMQAVLEATRSSSIHGGCHAIDCQHLLSAQQFGIARILEKCRRHRRWACVAGVR